MGVSQSAPAPAGSSVAPPPSPSASVAQDASSVAVAADHKHAASHQHHPPTEDEIEEEMQHHQTIPLPSWKDFVSGTVAGVAITVVGHPFDTVKVRLQTQDIVPPRPSASPSATPAPASISSSTAAAAPSTAASESKSTSSSKPIVAAQAAVPPANERFKGGMDCVRKTVKREGFFALYKGMSGPMLAVPVINAVVFAAYEQGLNFFRWRHAVNAAKAAASPPTPPATSSPSPYTVVARPQVTVAATAANNAAASGSDVVRVKPSTTLIGPNNMDLPHASAKGGDLLVCAPSNISSNSDTVSAAASTTSSADMPVPVIAPFHINQSGTAECPPGYSPHHAALLVAPGEVTRGGSTIVLGDAVIHDEVEDVQGDLIGPDVEIEGGGMSLAEVSLAGGWAGFINSIIVSPMELVKSRLQTQYTPHEEPTAAATKASGSTVPASKAAKQRGPMDVLREIYRLQGLRGVFRGTGVTIMREVPAYMGQFYVYELLKRAMTPEGHSTRELGAIPLMLAGGFAGIGAWIVSYPQDVIKSRIQVAPEQYPPHPVIRIDGGLIKCSQMIWRDSGFRGFWVGFGPCISRALPANAVGFLAYELSSRLLKDEMKSSNAAIDELPVPEQKKRS